LFDEKTEGRKSRDTVPLKEFLCTVKTINYLASFPYRKNTALVHFIVYSVYFALNQFMSHWYK
jgi:hypothetical protein